LANQYGGITADELSARKEFRAMCAETPRRSSERIARALAEAGVATTAATVRRARLKVESGEGPHAPTAHAQAAAPATARTGGPTWNEAGETATIEAPRGRVTSLDELLRIGGVDLGVWEVERHVVNSWEVGAVIDGAIVVEPLFQFKAWLRRIPGVTALRELHAAILADIAAHAPRSPKQPKRARGNAQRGTSGYLLEVSPFDLHVGKLAWGAETGGENYDSKIAAAILDAALDDVIAKSAPFHPERIVFPIGNDLLHTDGAAQTTTAGTPQDADTRHARMFQRAYRLMIAAIDRLELVAPVDVVIVPGNHDRDSMLKMGEVLAAWYRTAERVTVDNAPTLRKYYRWGTCLIGYTHGSEEKHDALPLIMANERHEEWAATTCREFHLGHLHTRRATKYTAGDTHGGVTVRILPSLCATDAWHFSKGYVHGPRAMESYLFHRDAGYAAHFSFQHRSA
jgi:hypothetical protein